MYTDLSLLRKQSWKETTNEKEYTLKAASSLLFSSLVVGNYNFFNSIFPNFLTLVCVTPYLFDSLFDIFSPPLCREREGCGGKKSEAVTAEESQTGDQRRQDGEQSIGESTPDAAKPCCFIKACIYRNVLISPKNVKNLPAFPTLVCSCIVCLFKVHYFDF